jgi:hypothetical protein
MTDSTDDPTLPELQRRRLLALVPGLALATSTQAQDAAQVQPQAYRVTLENEHVRVLEFVSRPGMGVCGSGVHSHPAHLTVALTNARVRVRSGGKEFIVENKPGDTFWEPAVTHETENLTGAEVRALIVEVKSPPEAKG